MHYLLQALSCHIQFLVRGLLRLFYKRMQIDYSLAHQKTIKRPIAFACSLGINIARGTYPEMTGQHTQLRNLRLMS